jgi:hypothetical protein
VCEQEQNMYNGNDRIVTGHVEMRTNPAVREIRIYTASSMMLQNSFASIQEHLPRPEPAIGVMNILVLCGNNMQYSSEIAGPALNELLRGENMKNIWHHVFFVPGPWEYCRGTLDLGDVYTSKLPHLSGEDRKRTIVVLGSQPNMVQSVLFVDFGLLITGAQCWPYDDRSYYDVRRIYHYSSTEAIEKGAEIDKEAVESDSVPTLDIMRERMERDVASIEASIARCPDVPVCMVITHGCPTALLCTDERRQQSDYYGTAEIALGKRGFLDDVDYWLYGADGDTPVARLASKKPTNTVPKNNKKQRPTGDKRQRNTLFVTNQFVAREQRFQWSEHITVVRTTK